MTFVLKPRFYCRKLDIMVAMCRLTDCMYYNQCHAGVTPSQAVHADQENVVMESVTQ